MFKGLLELAHGALSAPVPACSCAKGLAVGVRELASALRPGAGGEAGGASGGGSSGAAAAAPAAWPRPVKAAAARAGAAASSSPAAPAPARPPLAAAFHGLDMDSGLPAHEVHALRTLMLHARE
jgi:hypothetical protein